jgi:hypothetical protein
MTLKLLAALSIVLVPSGVLLLLPYMLGWNNSIVKYSSTSGVLFVFGIFSILLGFLLAVINHYYWYRNSGRPYGAEAKVRRQLTNQEKVRQTRD